LANSYSTIWDDGYPSGGNYWSHLARVDLYNGPGQNITGGDGICDSPYAISANNTDQYPLVAKWPSHDVAVLDVVPNSTIVELGQSVSFNVKVINQGDFSETFNITVRANGTNVAMNTVTNLTLRSPSTSLLTWNTTGNPTGNYTIGVYANPVQNETDVGDNTYTDGSLTVAGIHDVAVTSLATCKDGCVPMPTVNEGYTVHVNVTVANQGDFTENCNVTIYADETEIGSQNSISLPSGDQTVVTFQWNTSGYAIGNYTLSVYATPVLDEEDWTNNNFTAGIIKVTIVGDINGDDKVDMKDIGSAARGFMTTPGMPFYNPNADVTDDHKIDMKDIAIAAKHFMEHYP
jgi:hypothetical protein